MFFCRIYWTDAKMDSISFANFDGSDRRILIQDTRFTPHPYSVALYKVSRGLTIKD